MNNVSATHYSSGCRSGWTPYFDESRSGDFGDGLRQKEVKMADDEDLSMVSDASSGPPHYQDDNEDCFREDGYFFNACLRSQSCIKSNQKTKNKEKILQLSYLDDTASSPVFSKKRISLSEKESSKEDFSMGFSATHLNKNFGSFHCTLARNSASEESGGFHGEKLEWRDFLADTPLLCRERKEP